MLDLHFEFPLCTLLHCCLRQDDESGATRAHALRQVASGKAHTPTSYSCSSCLDTDVILTCPCIGIVVVLHAGTSQT
jgi:hypothetical protein